MTGIGTAHTRKWKDLTNQKFGRLIAIKNSGERTKRRCILWECLCDCGNIVKVSSEHLIGGATKSCGCLWEDKIKLNQRKLTELCTKEPGYSNYNGLKVSYRNSAKKRGLDFSLSDDEFRSITSSVCHYCGQAPKNYYKNPNSNGFYPHNGIDRVDSSKGYIIGNVVPCCKTCNIAKNSMTKEEFLTWVDRIYKYQHRED